MRGLGFSGGQAKPTPGSRPFCAYRWELQEAKGPRGMGRGHATGGGSGEEAVVLSPSTGLGPPNSLGLSPLAVSGQGHSSIKGKTAPIPPGGAGGSGPPSPLPRSPIEPARPRAWVCRSHVDLTTHRTGHLGKLWLRGHHWHGAHLLDLNHGGSQAHAHTTGWAQERGPQAATLLRTGLPLRLHVLQPRWLWGCPLHLRGLGVALFGTVNLQGLSTRPFKEEVVF